MRDGSTAICWCVFWVCLFGGCSFNEHLKYKHLETAQDLQIKLNQEENKRLELFGKIGETP